MNEHLATIASGSLLGPLAYWAECSCGRIGLSFPTEEQALDDQGRHVTGSL